jgi:hypothetical protein
MMGAIAFLVGITMPVLVLHLNRCGPPADPPASCAAPLTDCSGVCRNIVADDNANCGGCQRACPGGTQCRLGQCTSNSGQVCTTESRPLYTVKTCCRKHAGECAGLGQQKCLDGLGTPRQCCGGWSRPYVQHCTAERSDGIALPNPNTSGQGCDPCV